MNGGLLLAMNITTLFLGNILLRSFWHVSIIGMSVGLLMNANECLLLVYCRKILISFTAESLWWLRNRLFLIYLHTVVVFTQPTHLIRYTLLCL